MLGNKKFKTITVHTAHEGVSRDYIYEFLQPQTFRSVQQTLEDLVNLNDKHFISFETTDGMAMFRVWTISGFELEDPV